MSHQHVGSSRWRRSLIGIAATIAIPTGISTLASAAPAHAAGSAHYVDCSRSSNGDGSASSPWNSLAAVDAPAFGPGDQILFARGTTCHGTLSPHGSGASGAPIVIDAYGTGPKPTVAGDGAADAVVLTNQQYWEIRNLEVTNHGASAARRRGVHVVLQDFGAGNYYRLTNLTVHDVNGDDVKDLEGSAGIQFDVLGSSVKTKFNDVVLDGNDVYTVDRSGINMSTYWMCRASTGYESCTPGRTNTYYPWTGWVVKNNTVHDIGGDGIVMQYTQDGVAQNNVAYDTAARPHGSNAAIWVWNADHVIFQFNEAYATQKLPDNGDGQAWDADYGTDGTIYQYNYSHDNVGGMAMFCGCANNGRTDNATFRYNVSQNDGTGPDAPVLRDYGENNGKFYNNTVYVPSGSNAAILTTGGSTLAIANNIIVNNGTGGYGYNGTTFTSNIMAGSNTSNLPPGQLTSDPLLASPGSGGTGIGTVAGYQLTASSPAIGAGTVIPDNGGRDYWGNSVPAVCPPDIGADQYSSPNDSSCSGSSSHVGAVTSGLGGKCLDAANGTSTANGTAVDIWDCNHSTAQTWTVNGQTLTLAGKCLDVTAAATANGTPVELWDCNGGSNQKWTSQPNGSLISTQSGRCLDDPGFSTVNGTRLEIWDCNGGANQKWILP